jgi:hypothetical protein
MDLREEWCKRLLSTQAEPVVLLEGRWLVVLCSVFLARPLVACWGFWGKP